MIATIVETVFCGRVFRKSHHPEQTILKHLLQSHDSIAGSDDFGHLARLGTEVMIVVSNDAITDGIHPTVKIKQVLNGVAIFKTVHSSHPKGNQLWLFRQ